MIKSPLEFEAEKDKFSPAYPSVESTVITASKSIGSVPNNFGPATWNTTKETTKSVKKVDDFSMI